MKQLVCPNSIVISVSFERNLLRCGYQSETVRCPVLQITHSLSPARQFFEVANFGTVPSPSSDAIPRRERRHDGVGKVGDLSGIGYVRERREQNKLGKDEELSPFHDTSRYSQPGTGEEEAKERK